MTSAELTAGEMYGVSDEETEELTPYVLEDEEGGVRGVLVGSGGASWGRRV